MKKINQLKSITENINSIKKHIIFANLARLKIQHKILNKTPFTHRAIVFEKRLHADFFEKNNTFSNINNKLREIEFLDNNVY